MSSVSEQVGKVGDKLKNGVAQAKAQIVDLEKQVEDRVAKLEQQAKASLDDVAPQFQRIQKAWEGLLARLRSALAIATKRELEELASKVEDLASKVDRLLGVEAAAPIVTEAAPAAEAAAASEAEAEAPASSSEDAEKPASKKNGKKHGRK